ncbi:hypothetical protein, partial [Salmonella sp. s58408]|uniref:hypothetical protein n=1 Tax=Salmonella sp. s58408 TaxID=3159701 RepID=UPI003980498B
SIITIQRKSSKGIALTKQKKYKSEPTTNERRSQNPEKRRKKTYPVKFPWYRVKNHDAADPGENQPTNHPAATELTLV